MKHWESLMSMPFRLRPGGGTRFSISDRPRVDLGHACRNGGAMVMAPGPIGARALADQLGEARAERPQRRTADREADLGHREVAAPQQRFGPLDAAGHQVAVGRLAESGAEAAGEM